MKTEQILYLNDIAKTQSISQTAQRFFISQQALSFSLKKLEEEFDTIFLNRTNHGVTLTPEGSLFLRKTQAVLDIYTDLKESFQLQLFSAPEDAPLPPGKLHILGHTRVLEPLLADILEVYTRLHPQIQINLQERENIAILDAVAQGSGELGIIFAPEPLLEENTAEKPYQLPLNVQIEKLFSDDFILCCSQNHPLAPQKSLLLEDFADYPTVQFDTNAIMQNIGQAAAEPPRSHQYFSNNVSFHKDMIRRGLAISVITAFEFRKLYLKYKDLTALPIANSYKSIISIVTRKDQPLSAAAGVFIDMLRKFDFYRV